MNIFSRKPIGIISNSGISWMPLPEAVRKHEFMLLEELLRDAEKYDSTGDVQTSIEILLILTREINKKLKPTL